VLEHRVFNVMQLLELLEDNDIPCEKCKRKDDGEKMLLCDSCDFGEFEFVVDAC
jgi:hypothetical protein